MRCTYTYNSTFHVQAQSNIVLIFSIDDIIPEVDRNLAKNIFAIYTNDDGQTINVGTLLEVRCRTSQPLRTRNA